MQFTYTAKSTLGATTTGMVDAETISAARQTLRERGLFPLRLTQLAESGLQTVMPRGSLWTPGVKKQELMLMTSQLLIMTRAGIDLAESLNNVASGCRNPVLKQALTEIYRDVAGGQSFSAAIRRKGNLFGGSYVASIAAGEASGKIAEVLERLANMLGQEIKLGTAVRSAMAYPVVLMGVCFVVIAALLLFVLPNFEKVFVDMGVTPPASTRILLHLATTIRQNVLACGGVGIAAAIVGYKMLRTVRVRRIVDNMAMRAAIIGQVLQSLASGRLFVMLGAMLQSGVPLVQALQLCRTAARTVSYADLLDAMQDDVLNGRGISGALTRAAIVPAGAAQMIGTAEQTGKLGPVMQLVGEYYEAEGQRKIQELAKLLEPFIIIVMGVIVAIIVASIMLPMLDISSSASQ